MSGRNGSNRTHSGGQTLFFGTSSFFTLVRGPRPGFFVVFRCSARFGGFWASPSLFSVFFGFFGFLGAFFLGLASHLVGRHEHVINQLFALPSTYF